MRRNKAARVIDDLKWDPLEDFIKLSEEFTEQDLERLGITPFEIEPVDTEGDDADRLLNKIPQERLDALVFIDTEVGDE